MPRITAKEVTALIRRQQEHFRQVIKLHYEIMGQWQSWLAQIEKHEEVVNYAKTLAKPVGGQPNGPASGESPAGRGK